MEENNYEKYFELVSNKKQIIAIEIPNNFYAIVKENPNRANYIRTTTGEIFKDLFKNLYCINGFYRANNRNYYIAEKTMLV